MPQKKDKDIFINCPFDSSYQNNLYIICFTILHCGYNPRTTLEIINSAEFRLTKIINLIRACDYAIHDLSMITLDSNTNLPRFNMPFECGIFYGINQISKKKRQALVLELNARDTQKCLSDLSGIDPQHHQNHAATIINKVRNWIRAHDLNHALAGGTAIYNDFSDFRSKIPVLAGVLRLDPSNMDYNDTINLMAGYIKELKPETKT